MRKFDSPKSRSFRLFVQIYIDKVTCRPYSCSRYWTGTSLQSSLMQEGLFKCKCNSSHLNEIFPREPLLQASSSPVPRIQKCFRYWTGTSLQSSLMQEVFSNTNAIHPFWMTYPRASLYCKLAPVQCRKYEYGLLLEWILQNMVRHFVTHKQV